MPKRHRFFSSKRRRFTISHSSQLSPRFGSATRVCFLRSSMAELKTISAALKLIDAKKESLRKAFEDLEAHSSSLSSFTLTWSAIDAHFSSIQSSLSRQFEILESRTDSVPQNDTLPTNNAVSLPAQSNAVSLPPQNNAVSLPPQNNAVSLPPQESAISRPTQNSAVSRPPQNNANPSHPQLRLLCSAMDAEALRRYIMDHPNDRETLRSELLDAFQVARDPAKMVLDALTGFFPSNANEDGSSELHTMRRSCVFMLEQLMLFSPEIGEDVRQRAKSLAQEWKGKVKVGDNTLKPMGFLHLLAAYGLGSDYDSTELLELLIDVVRYREVFGLCRGLNLVDKVPGMLLRRFTILYGNASCLCVAFCCCIDYMTPDSTILFAVWLIILLFQMHVCILINLF